MIFENKINRKSEKKKIRNINVLLKYENVHAPTKALDIAYRHTASFEMNLNGMTVSHGKKY